MNLNPRTEERKVYGVYITEMLERKITLNITEVGKNIKQNLEGTISKQTEGKCISSGFIRPGSVRLLSYSSGSVAGDSVHFQTIFECMVCHPVEGMLIECDIKTITKAGIHAEVIDDAGVMPLTIFVARDHHSSDSQFAKMKENAKITVIVIGVRFELNDPYISVIAKLKRSNENYNQNKPITIRND